MSLRITQQTMMANTLRTLQDRLGSVETAQARLASGKRIHRPSDDVSGTNQSLRLHDELATTRQGARNVDDGLMWVGIADTQLQSVVSRLQRARELAVQAGSTLSAEERGAIAVEIAGIRDDVVAIANAKSQGRALFAGYSSGDAVARVGGVWTYTGDSGVTTRRVGTDSVVRVNVTGDDVFGFSTGNDVFTMLDTLEARVQAGDTSGVAASLGDIDTAISGVLDGLAVLGTAGNRLEAARARLGTDATSLETHISELEDVDLAASIMDLQLQQVAYQAALGAMNSTLQPSLIDFMR